MTSELEQRLRAALHARADLVTPDKLSPRPAPTAAPRLSRWIVPSLLAAAAVAALVVGGLLVPKLTATPAPPATSPQVSLGPSPDPTPTPAATPPPPPPSSVSGGPTAHGTAARYRSVVLNLPPGWRLIPGDPRSGAEPACVLRPGLPTPEVADDCPLTVQVMDDSTGFRVVVAPDTLGGARDSILKTCGDGRVEHLTPGRHSSERLDGRPAEFRTATVACGAGATLTVAQWVVTDHPNVVFVSRSRTGAGDPPQDVAAIVRGAQLPAGDGERTSDFGYLVGHKTAGGGVTLTFDRATHGSIWGPKHGTGQPADTNDNPATYDLSLAPDVLIQSGRLLCRKEAGQYDDTGLGRTGCTVAELTAALDDPIGLARSTPVWLTYDPQGRVTGIWEEVRS
jgi:hypothetical protein